MGVLTMQFCRQLLRSLVLMMVSVAIGNAQTTGTVQGTVTDAQGAVIPDAKLDLLNTATNQSLSQSATATGAYVFNSVQPGAYRLTVTMNGFRPARVDNLDVQVSSVRTVNVRLEVGPVTESVDVSAAAQQIDVVSAQVSTNVEQKLITNLPSYTRNVLTFAELQPGVDVETGFIAGGSQNLNIIGTRATVNGNFSGRNNFYLDGADNTGAFRNNAFQFPNPDTVQEVQISTSNTSAEYGRQVGGVFNVITRSGTNDFHGTGFYFFRNKSLNANEWGRNRSGVERPDDNQKMGGGTLGGRIIRNKTFFFGSMMAYRDKSAGFQNGRMAPTSKMLSGDFSELTDQLYHPDTREPLAGNRIPANLLDPVAANMAKLLPTVAEFRDRFVWDFTRPIENQEALAKVDHNFTDNNSTHVTFMRTWGNAQYPDLDGGYGNLPNWGPQINNSHQNTITARHNWVATPTLLVDAHFGYTQHVADRTNANRDRSLEDFGATNFPSTSPDGDKWLPGLQIGNVWGDGLWGDQGWLSLYDQHNYRFGSTVTWIRGSHNLKVGGDMHRDTTRQYNTQDYASFAFDGRYASEPETGRGWGNFGFAVADFLMGRTTGFNQQGVRSYTTTAWNSYFFVEDTWKINPRLTLTPGLRYEIYLPPTEKDGRMTSFVEGYRSTVFPKAPVGLAFPGDPGIAKAFVETRWNYFAPRLGLAWDLRGDGRTAIRAGIGKYYSLNALGLINALNAEQNPWEPSAGCGDTRLSNPWGACKSPVYAQAPTPFTSEDIANFPWPPVIGTANGYIDNFRNPYSWQWSAFVEREITAGISVEAGYVGNRGRHLPYMFPFNYARWQPDATADAANMNARRPIPGYVNVLLADSSGRSQYDALQMVANIRARGGLTGRITYALGKGYTTMNDATTGDPAVIANPLDPETEWGQTVRRHIFRSFYAWDIPWLTNRTSWAGRILSNWQLSGSIYASTGQPFDVTLGRDWNFDGVAGDRPDLVGEVNYVNRDLGDGFFEWIDLGSTASGDTRRGPFALPGGGTNHNAFGTLKRNSLFGPGFWGLDTSLQKNFYVTENQYFQFRLETYNTLNHPNLGAVNGAFSDGSFGRINGKGGNRRMQVGLKYYF